MGLLPPVILGALLIVAFALSAQQRLALNSRTGPMPARQIWSWAPPTPTGTSGSPSRFEIGNVHCLKRREMSHEIENDFG